MALVTADINWQGFGKITDADTVTDWAVLKTTSGGPTPSAALADGGLQGASSAQAITTTSNDKRILLFFDIGSGNELDFSGGGAEENEFVWVWGNFLASALLETTANDGFGIMLGTENGGTVDWSVWSFFGSENYAGGWKRMVIDPTKTASLTGAGSTEGGGGITLSSVRYFGIMAKTNATARFDNMLVDRMDVGTGYAIDGTGATADDFMADLLAVEETTANWWGVVTRLNDSGTAYGLVGKLSLGDSVGTTATTISDNNAKIFAEEPLYYDSGFVAALPLTATGIELIGNGTGATSVIIGEPVGSDGGRNGWAVVGNDTYDVTLDFDDGNVNTCEFYGCSFEGITGLINMGSTTAHKFFSINWTNCSKVDPVGGVQIRTNNFIGTIPVVGSHTAALLWNGSADIQTCQFIANDDPDGTNIAHGIEFPSASGGISLIDMIFSGNEVGVWFSPASGDLILNASGTTDLGSSDFTNDSSGSVTINNNISVTFTGMKDDTQVRVELNSTGAFIDGIEDVTSGSVDDRSFTWSASAGTIVDYILHNFDNAGPDYESIRVIAFTVPSDDSSIPIQQRLDRNSV